MSETSLYFAYGSNLNSVDWARWCAARPTPADPACMTVVGPAMLPDYELAFSRDSQVRGGGVLDVRPRAGHAVEGALMAVTQDGWTQLDIKEGVGFAYEQIATRVADAQGRWHDVKTYRVRSDQARRHVPPHEEYVSICAQGLRTLGLDPARLLDAAADRPARSAADGLFLSDALRERLEPVLTPAERNTLETASVNACHRHDSGALLRDTNGGPVAGAFLVSNLIEDLVERLDPLVGVAPGRVVRDLVAVETIATPGMVRRAWAYVIA